MYPCPFDATREAFIGADLYWVHIGVTFRGTSCAVQPHTVDGVVQFAHQFLFWVACASDLFGCPKRFDRSAHSLGDAVRGGRYSQGYGSRGYRVLDLRETSGSSASFLNPKPLNRNILNPKPPNPRTTVSALLFVVAAYAGGSLQDQTQQGGYGISGSPTNFLYVFN